MPKIIEQLQFESGSLQIIKNLASVRIIQMSHSFQFHNNVAITNEIRLVGLPQFLPFVKYFQLFFPFVGYSSLYKFKFKGLLVHSLKESVSQSIIHIHCSTIYSVTLLLVVQHLQIRSIRGICVRLFFYFIKISVWFVGVEDFVAVHYCYKVFGVGEVDDVVGVAWKHDYGLNLVATHLVVKHLVCAFLAELDKAVTANHDELLPLGVVPMLALGDAWLGDVDTHLTSVERVHQLGERTTVVHIHFQVENSLFLGQIA